MLRTLVSITTLALLASALAPTAAAHETCCSPFIELDGITDDPATGGGGGPDLPVGDPTLASLSREVYQTAARLARDVRPAVEDLRQALPLPVDPVPAPDPDYYGAVTVDVSFPEGCRCEILDAYLTWTEITNGDNDGIVPTLTQIDGDSWVVTAGDFDTYAITFHLVYDCGEGPRESTKSWTQYN